ncbi:MAG: type IV pilus assembly protein PilM [bacterium]|nr:type IV pilus assembly protein PilM [bacterium]
MAKIFTGLDIGSKTIKLVQLKRGRGTVVRNQQRARFSQVEPTPGEPELKRIPGRGTIQLVNFAISEIPSPLSEPRTVYSAEQPRTANPEQIAETIEQLFNAQKIRPTHVITAIPKHLTTIRSITLPTDSPAEIAQMIRFEAAKQIPFLSEDDILDFQIMGSSPLGGSQVLLVAVRKQIVDNHLALFKNIGIEPEIVTVSSVAFYTAAKQSDQLEEGAVQVLLDIGASITDLTLVRNRILVYSRSVPVAGNQLVHRLRDQLQIDELSAEAMVPRIDLTRSDFGLDTYHRPALESAISGWLESLDNEIKQSLEYFRSESGVAQLDSMIVSGGLSQMNGLAAHLMKELNLEIIPANPLNYISIHRSQVTKELNLWQPRLNGAIGLALRGFDTELGAGLNLLPRELLRQRYRNVQRRKYIASSALAGVIVLTALGTGYREYIVREQRLIDINLKLRELTPLASKLTEMQSQIERIKAMISPDDPAIDVLVTLSQLDFIPSQLAIIRFDYKRNSQLTIDGAALTLPDIIMFRETLDKSGLFELVKLRDTRAGLMEGKPVQFFTIECKLKKTQQELGARKI